MVKIIKKYISALIISAICGGLFIGIGYLYISANIKETEQKSEKIPYADSVSKNAGIMLEMASSKILLYLNFEEGNVSILFADNKQVVDGYCCGYSVDYIIEGDYEFLSGIIDRIGGIELYYEDNTLLNYTGVQVVDMLSYTPDPKSMRTEIVEAIFEKISQVGFSRSDFAYLIENTTTDLTIPDCYYWNEYMKKISLNTHIVN